MIQRRADRSSPRPPSPPEDREEWTAWTDVTERDRLARRRRRDERRARRAPGARDGHGDGDSERRADGEHTSLLASRWGRLLVGAVVLIALATASGLIALWPGGPAGAGASQAFGGATTGATVTRSYTVRCPGPTPQRCYVIAVRVDGGAPSRLTLGPVGVTSTFSAGDRIRVQRVTAPPGARNVEPYSFAGADRRGTLLWLAVAFAVLVIVLARWRGLLALCGFAASVLLIVKFLVPAILAGSPALLVAVVGALAVMFVTVGLTYGVTPQSAAAILGITSSLLFAAVVGTLAVHSARLDGRSSDLATVLSQVSGRLSLQGIVLAGLVLGALGVLADMAVTQASAVMALRRANPTLGPGRLYREGFAVGRDHLVATTHTLVLAYAGATLPLLLVLQSARVGTVDALNVQDLAEPIVATLVGAMALLISVPLTTAVSAAVVSRIPATALPDAGLAHHH
jgi:uncharacterized membrane protein